MKKLLLISAIISIVGGILLLGLGAIVPLTITAALENPTTFLSNFTAKINEIIPPGDRGWPMAIVLALLWPVTIITTYYVSNFFKKYVLIVASQSLKILVILFVFLVQNYLLVKIVLLLL